MSDEEKKYLRFQLENIDSMRLTPYDEWFYVIPLTYDQREYLRVLIAQDLESKR